jgi:hypothetical protein
MKAFHPTASTLGNIAQPKVGLDYSWKSIQKLGDLASTVWLVRHERILT